MELQVTGVEEGATRLVLRRSESSTGDVLSDLKDAIRRHRTALIARLLADIPVEECRIRSAAPDWADGKTLEEIWGVEALESHAKFGHRGARLYVNIDHQVWTSRGTGELINVLGGEARVLLDRDVSRAVAEASRTGKKKPQLDTVGFEIGEIFPMVPAGANRRFRPVIFVEFDLDHSPYGRASNERGDGGSSQAVVLNPLVGSSFYPDLQVKCDNAKSCWERFRSNLPQPYRNPLGYAASLPSAMFKLS